MIKYTILNTGKERIVMKKTIALIVFILMLLAGILLVAFGIGIGLLLLVVGMLGTVMMGIIVGSRGSIADIFTPRGFYDASIKTKIEKQELDQPVNIWDRMKEQKKD
jgi:hypothetical protein